MTEQMCQQSQLSESDAAKSDEKTGSTPLATDSQLMRSPADSITSLRVAYKILVTSGDMAVIALDSAYELPHALEKEFLPLTDSSSSKLFELLVTNPLQIGIRAFLQRRFEEVRAHSKSSAQRDRLTSFQEEESRAAAGNGMPCNPHNSQGNEAIHSLKHSDYNYENEQT